MKDDGFNNSPSGYMGDSFEGIDRVFTDVKVLSTSDVNVVAKAKRYGRWWLLKGLRQELASESAYQTRLRKELDILAQMQHPGVVAVSGIEVVEGLGECIVMEYVDGTTLDEWLRTSPQRDVRRNVARELAEAVAYIHSKGIVHRDLKPQNIIITHNGKNVKLIDFGLADTDSHAVLKQPAGTEGYISPEQKETAVADVRNDIYSLGVIFQQMDLGLSYRGIVRKCLLPADRRYQTTQELFGAMQTKGTRTWQKAAIIVALLVPLAALGFWGLYGDQAKGVNVRSEEVKGEEGEGGMLENHAYVPASAKEMQRERLFALAGDSNSEAPILSPDDKTAEHQRRIDDAISLGKKEIEKAIKATGIDNHLDTLSSLKYFRMDIWERIFEPDSACARFVKGLGKEFTAVEKEKIKDAIEETHGKWQEKMMTKYTKMLEKYAQ